MRLAARGRRCQILRLFLSWERSSRRLRHCPPPQANRPPRLHPTAMPTTQHTDQFSPAAVSRRRMAYLDASLFSSASSASSASSRATRRPLVLAPTRTGQPRCLALCATRPTASYRQLPPATAASTDLLLPTTPSYSQLFPALSTSLTATVCMPASSAHNNNTLPGSPAVAPVPLTPLRLHRSHSSHSCPQPPRRSPHAFFLALLGT